jgi:hypothetical protein
VYLSISGVIITVTPDSVKKNPMKLFVHQNGPPDFLKKPCDPLYRNSFYLLLLNEAEVCIVAVEE